MSRNQKTIDADEISEEFSHLEEERIRKTANKEEERELSILSEFQGKQEAEIVGIDIKNSRRKDYKAMILKLRAEDGTHKKRITNTREYNQDNPFVRFLRHYDISLSSPSELVGKNVTLIKRRKSWRLHYPDSLDKYTRARDRINMLGRLVGIQFLWRSNMWDLAIIGFVVCVFTSMLTLPLSEIISSLINVSLIFVFPIVTFGVISLAWISSRYYKVKKSRIKRRKESKDMPD